jgi:hypothetical protein
MLARGRAPVRALACALIAGALAAAGPASAPATAAAATYPYRVAVSRISLTVHGQTATGVLFTPYRTSPGDVPVTKLLVFCHGHGDSGAADGMYIEPVVAADGAAAVAMDNRGGAGGWNVTTGSQDTVAATEAAKRLYPGIRETVLWGWSMGGITSGMAIAYGPPGLYDYWLDSFGAMQDAGAWLLEDHGGVGQVAADAGGCTPLQCPLNYLARTPPLLASRMRLRGAIFVHGVGDTTVPFEQSLEMQLAAQLHGIPTSFYTVLAGTRPGGGVAGLAGHGWGATAYVAMQVATRVLAGTEPARAGLQEHMVVSAPATPPPFLTPTS